MNKQNVLIRIEPSKELSSICGFPYFVEKRVKVSELLKDGIINKEDIRKMANGEEICKNIPVI